MDNLICSIDWMEKTGVVETLSSVGAALIISPMAPGLEAEVFKITAGTSSYVLKVWSKSSKPDIQYQFHLLKALIARGIAVSEPLGWGIDRQSNKVLLTSYDGTPIVKVNPKKVTDLAHILSQIHNTPIADIEESLIRRYDFMDYFFGGIGEFPDIRDTLTRLIKLIIDKQESLIHGDYNLGNILEGVDNKFTVIDWTNGQIGDPRYDVAWSSLLLRIYTSERNYSLFISTYLLENPLALEQLELFEAIACNRWILLNRTIGLPKRANTIAKVKSLIKNNPHLDNDLFVGHIDVTV
jgi:aminoglycoside phosphotransferase (APT) family kinase protein